MSKKLNQLIRILKEELRILISIGLGVFFFVLFFETFPLDHFDFNNRLLFIAGLGVIVFVSAVLVRVVFPWFKQKNQTASQETPFQSYLGSFIILATSVVAFAFYLHFVGDLSLTFFIMFKVALICLFPVAILRVYDMVYALRHENQSLIIEQKIMRTQLEKYENDYLSKTILLISENSAENVSLMIADIVFVKSADNYVEVVFKEGDIIKKKLLRNTLKNLEQQLSPYSNFIRCHRICIVNINYIDQLNKDFNSHWLTIKGIEEQIPVSRQYLLKLKETL